MAIDLPDALKRFFEQLPNDFSISNINIHAEGKDYSACHFQLNKKTVEFRLSKITPKKIGAFVAIWKRSQTGITQPFDETDNVDFAIIACQNHDSFGAFIFPKSALLKNRIFSAGGKDGKRGIRVYPPWDLTDNPQAKKTQIWQNDFFVEFGEANRSNQLTKILLGV